MHALEKRILLPQNLKPLTSIAEYKSQGGLQGLAKARSMAGQDVINLVKEANLRGRGGAGFPAAIKWQTTFEDDAENKFVVCNFAEGEPGTNKDRYLASKNPYLVFEGMLIVGHAINAKQVVMATKEKFKDTVEVLKRVIKEYETEGVVQPGFIRLVLGPDDYLFGEEKALLEVVDGRDAMPRFFPPFMVGVGIGPNNRNPAIVNNFESMSWVALILRNGAEWFKSMGSADTPGTVLLSLSGDLKTPGMYEVETGLTVRQMLYELGGGPIDASRPFKAIFSGFSNRPLTPDQFDLAVDFGTLRNNGVGLGSAGFMVYDQSRCMVNVALMISKFLAVSSCGQCIPCNAGTRDITLILQKLVDGEGTKEDLEEIRSIAGRCTNQTRCFLPTQESILIPSIMDKFAGEFENLVDNPGDHSQNLVLPKIKKYDEEAKQFVFEDDPVELREEMLRIFR